MRRKEIGLSPLLPMLKLDLVDRWTALKSWKRSLKLELQVIFAKKAKKLGYSVFLEYSQNLHNNFWKSCVENQMT